MTILAIDAGTTGMTALLVTEDAKVVARGYSEFPQHFPADGWVEHDPDEIWEATLTCTQQVLESDAIDEYGAPTCLGITNQRETIVLWDKETLAKARMAIVWQDRRTAGYCDQLKADGKEDLVREQTGLRLDPYFSGSKLAWIAKQEPEVWAGVESGKTVVGTVDSYLIARMSGGAAHVTDGSNASRTLLFDITTGEWSPQMCELFNVPMKALPEVVASYGICAQTDPASYLDLDIPISGIAGDQQSALFGQACFQPGSSKCTYGTGSFVLVNTGDKIVRSDAGLLSTVAWKHPDGTLTYALEGAIFVTGAAVQWLRDGLHIIDNAAETEEIANSVPNSAGVVFVPALTGLGAPDWDPNARGAIFGLTRGATDAHVVRATLESIAYQVRDVIDVMVVEARVDLPRLTVDGGAAANNLLCQLQADQIQVPVARSEVLEATGMGAAFLAGLGAGVWSSQDELAETWRSDATFEPGQSDEKGHRRWRVAVERTKGWATAVNN